MLSCISSPSKEGGRRSRGGRFRLRSSSILFNIGGLDKTEKHFSGILKLEMIFNLSLICSTKVLKKILEIRIEGFTYLKEEMFFGRKELILLDCRKVEPLSTGEPRLENFAAYRQASKI